MSTNSTTSNYISKINQQYPTAGQDNDSQGFRDNFKNIAQALTAADEDIDYLKLNSVKLTSTNDFNNNIIKQVSFQDCSDIIFDDTATIQLGDVVVDYRNGGYQKFKVSEGSHRFTVSNWPPDQTSGHLTLSITTASSGITYVDFGATNLINLGPGVLPLNMPSGIPQVFELWNDNNGVTEYVFVKGINEKIPLGTTGNINSEYVTGTYVTAVQTLSIGGNIFQTGTNFSTLVTTNSKFGNVALLPNQITTTISGSAVADTLGDTVASTIPIATSTGIKVGAIFAVPGATTTFTVVSFTDDTVTITPPVEVALCDSGVSLIFTNPRPTNQPTVVTVKPTAVSSTSAVIGDLKGQIYANASSLYVAYADYAYNTTNWAKFNAAGSIADTERQTQNISNNSTKIATTEFVHSILPYGTIIMWSGASAAVPTGWTVCDGDNSTPDLRGRFVIGAGGTFNPGNTGGNKDAVVVSHSHTASVTDSGHNHQSQYDGRTPSGIDNDGAGSEIGGMGTSYTYPTTSATTGITVGIDISGSSGVDANMPPYYALCYIMKTTGA